MKKRNWPDHPGIGKSIKFNGEDVTVVDVKAGPMLVDTSSFDKPEADISGTLKLRIKYPAGHEVWTPPIDGKSFVSWCESQAQKDARP